MTQKELLYVEDAISHEKNIIALCNDIASRLDDEKLVSFVESEEKKHQKMHEKLLNVLKEETNE